MGPDFRGDQGGGDTFVVDGFKNWKDKSSLQLHVGGPNSAHNVAWRKCEPLMNQRQHVEIVITKQSNQAKQEYHTHLTVAADCIRFLLRQGLAFRGHDESHDSCNQGNFLELLQFLATRNEIVNKVFKNARGNLKLVASTIQKDIVSAVASETTCAIIDDIGNEFFAILIDESHDMCVCVCVC
ncbi:hypothetical protein V6N13_126924 [Hibiscus sabdariffa]